MNSSFNRTFGQNDTESIDSLKNLAHRRLVETGERDKLIQTLKTRLTNCGWKDQLKQFCWNVVKERGVDNVTIDDIVNEVSPKAKEEVPDDVRKELVEQIRLFLNRELNDLK